MVKINVAEIATEGETPFDADEFSHQVEYEIRVEAFWREFWREEEEYWKKEREREVGLRYGPQGAIYFIAKANLRFVKIGFTSDIKTRIQSLQTASDQKLFVLAVMPGTQKNENQLHRQFSRHRKRGEWFRLSMPILLKIFRVREEFEQPQIVVQWSLD